MTEKNALDYIRSASFYTSAKYQWVKPIIDAVLGETFEDSLVYEFVDSLYKGLAPELESEREKEPPAESKIAAENDRICVEQILSIDKIQNIGLVDISEQLPFNDGLNVVYGKNASGKSSLYIAICNTLGISKPVFSNLNKIDDAVYAQLSVYSNKIEPLPLDWNGKLSNSVQGVKVFDSDICTYLVERDQVNQFELAHLKSEYFQLLNNAFNNVSDILARIATDIQKNNDVTKDAILKVFPQFLEYEPQLSKETVERFEFTNDKDKELAKLEAEILLLGKQDIDSVIKNLGTAEGAGQRIIESFGEWQIESTAEEKSESKWVFTFP
ncbi:MAG: ATP-binding protein, partial [Deltaproteobacteria bacterium]|nr:ATP-binding protein [Deltaproteobacteria bacterium]